METEASDVQAVIDAICDSALDTLNGFDGKITRDKLARVVNSGQVTKKQITDSFVRRLEDGCAWQRLR